MYSQLLISFLGLFLFTAEIAESAEKTNSRLASDFALRAASRQAARKTKRISWDRVTADITSACSHRGVGPGPYGPEAAISAVRLLYVI